MTRRELPTDPLCALRAGDPAPFEEFVRGHARTLFAFFRHRGASTGRAEDLTQEVFLKLYQGASRYRPEERFGAYCFRVARNVWIDDCRRAGARLESEASADGGEASGLAGVHDGSADPAQEVEQQESERRWRAWLATLAEPQRSVVELAVLGELSYAEIGALLAVPVGTVKSRMFYALRRLRSAVAELGKEA